MASNCCGDDAGQRRVGVVDAGVDDGDAHILAAGLFGIERDAVEGIVDDAGGLLQRVDVVGLAPLRAAVGGKLRQHDADRAPVGDAEAHQRGAEQPRLALRAHLEAEGGGDLLHGAGIAVDGHQHLVGHEIAGDRARRLGQR